MNTTIPAEVLAVKNRLDQWRATRNHIRERIPVDLRQAMAELCQRHSPALIRRVLKIDPWRLNGSVSTMTAPKAKTQEAVFIQLPADGVLPAPISMAANPTSFRLQLERPDGSRLSLTSPALDLVSARQICADFLRGNQQ